MPKTLKCCHWVNRRPTACHVISLILNVKNKLHGDKYGAFTAPFHIILRHTECHQNKSLYIYCTWQFWWLWYWIPAALKQLMYQLSQGSKSVLTPVQILHSRRQFIGWAGEGSPGFTPSGRFMETAGAFYSCFCIWWLALFLRLAELELGNSSIT